MSDSGLKSDILPQRLCSEIQLFDLCELDSCSHKEGRFCADPDLLTRFEKISEKELRIQVRHLSEDSENSDADDEYGYEENDDDCDRENVENDEDDFREYRE
jgi:hypothetical protein